MSLKTFHYIFVSVCLALTLGLAVWFGTRYAKDHELSDLGFAFGWLLGGVGLTVYARYVVRKLQHLSYL